MYKLVISQQNMLLLSFLLGVLLGATYDLFRGLRRVFPHRLLLICLEDILYWLFWTIAIIYIIQDYNNGILRLYIFLAMLAGLVVYLCTISRLYIFLILKVIHFSKKMFDKLNKLLKNVAKKVRMKVTVKRYRKNDGGG